MVDCFPRRLLGLLDDLPQPARKLNIRNDLSLQEIYKTRLYGIDYYDGERRLGYGGYKDDGRWIPVAKKISNIFEFKKNESFLDIGCAKGYLLQSIVDHTVIKKTFGIDASLYALSKMKQDDRVLAIHANATSLPFEDKSIDYIVSINSLHNFLSEDDVGISLSEIQRVCKKFSYVRVAAFSSNSERLQISQWASAGRCYLHVNDWLDLFVKYGYRGFYDFWHPNPEVIL